MNSVDVNISGMDYAICLWRTSFRHPVNLVFFSLLGVVLAFGQIGRQPHDGAVLTGISIVSSFITSILCMVFGILISTFGMVLLSRKERGVLGEQVFRVTDAGLQVTSATREGLVKWGGAQSLRRTRRHLYIRLTHSACLDIPRRFFADASADDDFWNALQPLVAKKKF